MGSEQKPGFGDRLMHKLHIGKGGHTAPSSGPTGASTSPVNNLPGGGQSYNPNTSAYHEPSGPTRPAPNQGTAVPTSGYGGTAPSDERYTVPAPVGGQPARPMSKQSEPSSVPHAQPSETTKRPAVPATEAMVDAAPHTGSNTAKPSTGLDTPNTDYKGDIAGFNGKNLASSGPPTPPKETPGAPASLADQSNTTNSLSAPPKQSTAPTFVGQVQQGASQAASQAAVTAQQLAELSKEKAAQAYSAVTSELDRQGVPEASRKKMADIGQGLKDYGAVGQERAADYFQQAVDTAHAVGSDQENRGIIVRVLGAVALVWLAFGFSLRALLTLGLVAAGAMVLSQYSRRGPTSGARRPHSSAQAFTSNPGPTTAHEKHRGENQIPAAASLTMPSVETHYPTSTRGATHPDASINLPGQL